MCVIIIKAAGQQLPTDTELRNAHRRNPHGCGFVSKSHHYKGMNFDTFLKYIHKVPKEEACIIHFRLATHGSKCKANCHPFNRGNIWFAHNGILSIRPEGDMTDSETAFQNIIYPAIQKYGFKSSYVTRVIDKIIGYSKFAMMDENGNVRTFGQFIRFNGRLYSNLNHIDRYDCYQVSPMQTAFLPTMDDDDTERDEFASFDDWYRARRLNHSRMARRVV